MSFAPQVISDSSGKALAEDPYFRRQILDSEDPDGGTLIECNVKFTLPIRTLRRLIAEDMAATLERG